MRIDKYLWSIRIFKSRSLSTENCKSGKVKVKQENIKPSRVVKIGEVIDVKKGPIVYSFQVLDLPKSRVGAKLVELYMKEVTIPEELEKIEIMKLTNKMERQRGMGRPTKRERRALNKFREDADGTED